tara:strand:+ start:21764 stop:22240 length:477 start_codon:yes stop_codon:yes gene_type:complete
VVLMKKSLIILSVVLLGLLFVIGCGEKAAPAVDSVPEEAVEEKVMEKVENPVVEKPEEPAAKEVAPPAIKEFTVNGKNWEFDVKEIKVKAGDTVKIQFTSTSGFHDWVVDEFNAATDQVNSGGQTSVEFVANKAGTYEYYCSVGNHRARGMVGTLIVE